MRQPQPPDTIQELRQWLTWAVPLRIAELEWNIAHGDIRRTADTLRDEGVIQHWLVGLTRRSGLTLGENGDELMFSDRSPRSGRLQITVTRTAGDLATGIAAAALLAAPNGVEVFGLHFAPTPRNTWTDDFAREYRAAWRGLIKALEEITTPKA